MTSCPLNCCKKEKKEKEKSADSQTNELFVSKQNETNYQKSKYFTIDDNCSFA